MRVEHSHFQWFSDAYRGLASNEVMKVISNLDLDLLNQWHKPKHLENLQLRLFRSHNRGEPTEALANDIVLAAAEVLLE